MTPSLHGRRVLVVDDSRTQALEAAAILESCGAHVQRAHGGDEALRHLREGPFDVVLSDVAMPDMSGHELCARVCADSELCAVPVILMTSRLSTDDVVAALDAGAASYVSKPIEPTSVVARILWVLGRRGPERAASPDAERVSFEIEGRRYTASARGRGVHDFLAATFEDLLHATRRESDLERANVFVQAVLDALTSHVAVLDARGRIVYVNEAWRRFGAERGMVWADAGIGRDYLDALLEDTQDEAQRAVREGLVAVVEGRAPSFLADYPCHEPGGEERFLVLRATRFEIHGVAHVVVTHQDVTQERLATRALARSEARFRALVEGSPFGVAVVEQGRFVYAKDLPVPPRQLGLLTVRAYADELVWPEDREAFVAALEGAGAGGRRSLEARLQGRAERARTVQLVVSEVTWDGRPATLSVVLDVSERRALEAKVALAERLASVGMLAAGVAHEINNPLTYVGASLHSALGELDALEKRALEEAGGAEVPAYLMGALGRLRELATDAHEGTERVRRIVADLRTFARAEEDSCAPVDLRRVVESAAQLAAAETRYRARVVTELAFVSPVLANEGRLSQVVLNLIVNAAHAIGDGDPEANEIRLRTRMEAAECVLEVSDTGCGVPAEQLGRIFEPFFTTKAVGVGSGLGLSICHSIVAGYGGTLQVQSEVGRGSTFRVRLPALLEGASPSTPRSPSVRAPRPAARGRVLVVDDDPRVRRALARVIERAHDVVTVDSGRAAMTALSRDDAFDAVLCDLMMSDGTGMELEAWLRAHRPGLRERTTYMSGGAVTAEARAFVAEAGDRVVPKPLDLGALMARLGEMVEPRPAPPHAPPPPAGKAPR